MGPSEQQPRYIHKLLGFIIVSVFILMMSVVGGGILWGISAPFSDDLLIKYCFKCPEGKRTHLVRNFDDNYNLTCLNKNITHVYIINDKNVDIKCLKTLNLGLFFVFIVMVLIFLIGILIVYDIIDRIYHRINDPLENRYDMISDDEIIDDQL